MSYKSASDVLHTLHLFRLLTNVTKAKTHLHISLIEDESLQESKQDTEDVMMKIESLDDGHQKLVTNDFEEAIADNEKNLKYATGSSSQDKMISLCGYGY